MQSTTFVTSLSGNLKLKLMGRYNINFWCPRECASHPVFANLCGRTSMFEADSVS